MIIFETWLSQIFGYCHLIAHPIEIMRAWIDGDAAHTSVTSFDELYEQIFDDLDSDNIEQNFDIYLVNNSTLKKALSSFLAQFRAVNVIVEKNPYLSQPSNLLASEEWSSLIQLAQDVIDLKTD